MEKLEEKIEGIISDHCGIVSINYDGMKDSICSEIQSVAIAFAKYRSESIAKTAFNEYLSTDEEYFSDFINNHYNK